MSHYRMSSRYLLSIVGLIVVGLPSLRAEVVEYRLGDTLSVSLQANTAATTEHIRTLILVGPTKLTIKGTWRNEDLDVILGGNTVRLALRSTANVEIPVGIMGDNGMYYHVVVKPVASSAKLDPVINVIASIPSATGTKGGDPEQKSGGHWEHSTNLVIRLQKHIRGGRISSDVSGTPTFNEERMQTEGVRVPGRRWTESDDWKVFQYYSWTLDDVTASYIGVTYTGRMPEVLFDYTKQRTDTTIAIWHQPVPGEPELFNRKFPGISLRNGHEAFFILYSQVRP